MARSRSSFVGRQQEVAALKRRYASSDSELLVVYGRRRVGKTELLAQVSHDKPTDFFTANAKLLTAQVSGFMRAAASWLRMPALAAALPADWEAAFGLVLGAARRSAMHLLRVLRFSST